MGKRVLLLPRPVHMQSGAANKSNIYKAAYTQQHIRKSEATWSKTFLAVNKSLFLQNKLGAWNTH